MSESVADESSNNLELTSTLKELQEEVIEYLNKSQSYVKESKLSKTLENNEVQDNSDINESEPKAIGTKLEKVN